MAYDKAAVQMKGLAAITNFDLSLYLDLLDPGVLTHVCRVKIFCCCVTRVHASFQQHSSYVCTSRGVACSTARLALAG